MARKKNVIPSYLLHKSSGQARVRIAGKDHLLGIYGSDESRRKYGTLVAKFASGIAIDPLSEPKPGTTADAGPSIAELLVSFMAHAAKHYRKNGEETSEICCLKSAFKPLRELYGLTPAALFGPLMLAAVRAKFVESGQARNTVNRSVGRIRRLFRFGVANEIVSADVLAKLVTMSPLLAGRTTAPDLPPRHAVDQANIDAVRKLVKPLGRDLIDLQLLTGSRSGELVMLTTSMIDRSGKVWVAKLADHKCVHHGKTRTLFFGPQSQLILAKYLAADPDRLLFGVTVRGYWSWIYRACDKAGISHWSPHWLRHTAATRIREKLGIESVQSLLGHSTAEMSRHYSDRMDLLAAATAAACG